MAEDTGEKIPRFPKLVRTCITQFQDAVLTGADIAVLQDDENLSLTKIALQYLQDYPTARLYVAPRDITQAFHTLDLAEESGNSLEERVFIAGYQSEIQLDIFFADAATGFGGATRPASIGLVLATLPKAHETLTYWSASLGSAIQEEALLIIGGRNKYLTKKVNEILAKHFKQVWASLGSGKYRCILARNYLANSAGYQPLCSTVQLDLAQNNTGNSKHFLSTSKAVGVASNKAKESTALEFNIYGFGGVFAGGNLDFGALALLSNALADLERDDFHFLDLGCGNGTVAKAILTRYSKATGVATDIAADAITSAHFTLLNEILEKRVRVKWDDTARSLAEQSFDIVFLNPPFHKETEVDSTLIQAMLAAAWRVLRPRGTLYLVHNSHLRYRYLLESQFKTVRELGRNDKFTVLRADK